ncbi:MAG: MFS transporter [Proteobacteria bacterium]|nr:MFS transporter [Pseudomonadota bacterium]
MAEAAITIEATAIPDQEPDRAPDASMAQRMGVLLSGGVVLVLLQFASPAVGLIGLPITFFLKNKLHLDAQAVANFNLFASIPLILSFLIGFLRDRWNPFGLGDRGYLTIFGAMTAVGFAIVAFLPPSYATLLFGVLLVSSGLMVCSSAARALTSAIGQKNAVTGMAGTIVNLASLLPDAASFALGGFLSQALEGHEAAMAARAIFLLGAGLMIAVMLFGLFGPRRLFDASVTTRGQFTFWADVGRLAGHWPVYLVMLIYVIWQFGPAGGVALQFHLANDLHATDAQVGLWYALFSLGFIPVITAYGWLCSKLKLRTLLWVGTLLAIPQFAPFFFIHSVRDSLVAAVVLGLLGGLGQGAYVDLAIRVTPKGLQGTMMMLLVSTYWFAYRGGDLLGARLYKTGGFNTAVIVTIIVYALILPLLLLVPRRYINSADGQAPAEAAP